MPSIGWIKQLSVLGVAAAVLGVTASTASADNEVWLYACHGPEGTSVASPNRYAASVKTASANLPDACGASATGAYSPTLTPSSGSILGQAEATSVFNLPSGVGISAVKLTRATHGFGGASTAPLRYQVATQSGPLEQQRMDSPAHADLSGETTLTAVPTASGDQLRIGVFCDTASPNTPCASADPVSVDVSRVAIKVTEPATASDPTGAPRMAVGGITDPAAGTLKLDVQATDSGLGLDYAEAWFDGQPKSPKFKFAGTDPKYATCVDMTPATEAVIDLPLDAVCPTVSAAKLDMNTTSLANGPAAINVRVVDLAGKEVVHRQAITINNNPDLGQSSRTLSIGTSGITIPAGTNNTPTGTGGVAGAQSQSCNSPRLSVLLAQKPVRISKGVPVLRYAKRYKFTGRLTCVINGKRKSAPKRTRIDLLSKVGKKTADKSGTTIRDGGAFSIIVAYRSSRTLTFSYTNADGKRSQVSIKVKVEKKKRK